MPIGKALLLKSLGGLAALGGTIGGGCYLYDHFSNQETRFDRGLIDYLEAGGKIQFSVKNGSNADISDSFPQFTTGTTPPTATVTIKVSVNATGNDGGTLTDATSPTPIPEKGKKANLKKLNGSGEGADWTWECKIVFKKTETATVTELKEEEKKKVFNDTDPKGLLNKLKESGNKNQKIKFVKDCAEARGIAGNRKINRKESLDSNKIESTKTFELIDNSETTKKLIPEDQSDFDYWFANIK